MESRPFYDLDDNWRDHNVMVKLPSDKLLKDKQESAKLSGPVVTYNLKEVSKDE